MFGVLAKRDLEKQPGKETIHSGHFMVSEFEAEEQDDEYEVAVPVPESEAAVVSNTQDVKKIYAQQPLTIDTSLAKLFQCMSIAYRQKLTSPKWNRFRGVRLRWKDKIRLNNVIWRCWHMQFIKKINTLICPFASPLDVDTHNKPEAIVLEGKYWKRKLAAVTAEYKKWRMFYRNYALGHTRDASDTLNDLESLAWHSQSSESMHMMVDEDYLGLMSDTLFSTISSQPFVFPDTREIAKAGLADFIQPSLGPLQPNLDDYMDTFEPLQEFMSCKLPTVPEESAEFKQQQQNWCYTDLDVIATSSPNMQLQDSSVSAASSAAYDPKHDHYDLLLNPSDIFLTSSIPEPQIYPQKTEKLDKTYNYAASKPLQYVQAFKQPAGYKFTSAVANFKFTEDKQPQEVKKVHRVRQRSNSASREVVKRPPLITAISDSNLIASSSTSVLLTQLLNPAGFSKPPDVVRIKDETLIIPICNLGEHSNSSSPASSQGVTSCPTSPQGVLVGSPTRDPLYIDHRRVGHIHAEQKRRYNIKNGFDMLHLLIPQLNQNPNAKLSKAAMLQKGADYIKQLQHERSQLKDEMDKLRQQIETLNTSISNCQSLLPATGAPVSRRRDSKMQEMFDDYVRKRTMEDWKFWIFSLLFRPLLSSFNNFVSTTGLDDLYRSTLHWIEQHCTLVDLRPVVLNSLRYLSTKTEILTEPENLPEEARRIVSSPNQL